MIISILLTMSIFNLTSSNNKKYRLKRVFSFLHPTTVGRGMRLFCYVMIFVELLQAKKMNEHHKQ